MQTIKIDIEESIYSRIVEQGVDLQEILKEFIYDLSDDVYPAISTEEAKKRVEDALSRYKNRADTFSSFDDDYKQGLDNYIESL